MFRAFVLAVEGDLSGHWKCNGVGGATKVRNNPCLYCLVTTATLLSYSTDYAKCKWCSELIRIGWIKPEEKVTAKSFKCIRHDMLIMKLLPTLKQELVLAKQELPSDYVPLGVVPPLLQSHIDFDSPTTIDLASAVSICFECTNNNNSSQQNTSFFLSLVHDMQLRGQALPFQTPTIQAQTTPRGIMTLETTVKRLEAEIAFIETNATTAAYLTENACPCSLYLEM
jgi:hypothetical protein